MVGRTLGVRPTTLTGRLDALEQRGFVLIPDALDAATAARVEAAVDRIHAQEAAAGRKRMLVTHSEIFPGTFASTTETADYLLDKLGLKAPTTLDEFFTVAKAFTEKRKPAKFKGR